MINIGGIWIDKDITTSCFSCDIKKCRGACCTFYGRYGAPVSDAEAQILEDCLPHAAKYLSKKSLKYIKKRGVTEGPSGSKTTVCIKNRACVFVYYEDDVALCSLERAYLDGEIKFRKPISCNLFPLRMARDRKNYLYYQRIPECDSAVANGERNKVKMCEELKDALINKFGESWYSELLSYINMNETGNKVEI